MVRFLHTADWQMGMRAAKLGEAGKRVREERLAAGRRVVLAAKENAADFILLAGDLFEDNAVERTLVQQVADILASAPCPVFVIPGNHDPLVPGSVWEHRSWESAKNVVILRESEPFSAPGCSLYPCPVKEKQSGQDPTAWISAGGDGKPRIGLAHGSVEGAPIGEWDHPIPRDAANRSGLDYLALAHGSVEGAPIGEWDHPIPRDAANRSGLDYLALGHWHSFGTFEDSAGASRMAYSGTHEPTSFGERDSGKVLLVEIAEAGVAPKLTPVGTGGLQWVSFSEQVHVPGDLEAVRAKVEALSRPDSTLFELSLSGLVSPADQGELERIRELAGTRFLWAQVDASGLAPAPEDDTWIEALPVGLLREVADRIRHGDADPGVKVRALLDLYALVGEARS